MQSMKAPAQSHHANLSELQARDPLLARAGVSGGNVGNESGV